MVHDHADHEQAAQEVDAQIAATFGDGCRGCCRTIARWQGRGVRAARGHVNHFYGHGNRSAQSDCHFRRSPSLSPPSSAVACS